MKSVSLFLTKLSFLNIVLLIFGAIVFMLACLAYYEGVMRGAEKASRETPMWTVIVLLAISGVLLYFGLR